MKGFLIKRTKMRFHTPLKPDLLQTMRRWWRSKLQRESIVTTLNEAIARSGKKLGVHRSDCGRRLPLLSLIQDAQMGLEEGSRKFIDILRSFQPYT